MNKLSLNEMLWIGIGVIALVLFFKDVPAANMDLVKMIVAAAIGAVTGAAITAATINKEN